MSGKMERLVADDIVFPSIPVLLTIYQFTVFLSHFFYLETRSSTCSPIHLYPSSFHPSNTSNFSFSQPIQFSLSAPSFYLPLYPFTASRFLPPFPGLIPTNVPIPRLSPSSIHTWSSSLCSRLWWRELPLGRS